LQRIYQSRPFTHKLQIIGHGSIVAAVSEGALMTRISKQAERRMMCPRRPSVAGKKTGSKKDQLKLGFKLSENAVAGELGSKIFIGKVR
jgi:hypothetical protein